MKRRQTSIPRQWLIVHERLGDQMWKAVERLPRGSGVLILVHDLPAGECQRLIRRLRKQAVLKSLLLVDETKGAARVHNVRELGRALLARTPLILLSPLYETRSHPDWQPIPRMRAAAYARLARRGLIALGGMDERRFRRIERLGFAGWAGIGAWLRT
jgi:thiamine-phosphate pyrophosphorylase